MLYPRTPSDTRAKPQCESGDSLLAEVQTEDDLYGGCDVMRSEARGTRSNTGGE